MDYKKCLLNLQLLQNIENILKNIKNKVVFLCLGNIKVNFDCFASFIAENLKKLNVYGYVYGGEKCPLYGESLEEMKNILERYHKNDTIIFVDVVKTKEETDNGKIIVSSKKFQVANSEVVFNYDYSICYLVKINENIDHFSFQKYEAEKIATYIANCCQIF